MRAARTPRSLFRNRIGVQWWRWTAWLGFAIAYPSSRFARQQQRQALIELLGRHVAVREVEALGPEVMASIPQRLVDLVGVVRSAKRLADELRQRLPVERSRRRIDVDLVHFDLTLASRWAELALVEDSER